MSTYADAARITNYDMLWRDIGVKGGKYYSVNVPLQEGIDDASYQSIFKPVLEKVMEIYQPTGKYFHVSEARFRPADVSLRDLFSVRVSYLFV